MARRRMTIQVQIVLRALAGAEPTGLTGYEIGTRTGLNRPTVYRMIERLVTDEWATSMPVEGTFSNIIKLTELGRSKYAEVQARPANARQYGMSG